MITGFWALHCPLYAPNINKKERKKKKSCVVVVTLSAKWTSVHDRYLYVVLHTQTVMWERFTVVATAATHHLTHLFKIKSFMCVCVFFYPKIAIVSIRVICCYLCDHVCVKCLQVLFRFYYFFWCHTTISFILSIFTYFEFNSFRFTAKMNRLKYIERRTLSTPKRNDMCEDYDCRSNSNGLLSLLQFIALDERLQMSPINLIIFKTPVTALNSNFCFVFRDFFFFLLLLFCCYWLFCLLLVHFFSIRFPQHIFITVNCNRIK